MNGRALLLIALLALLWGSGFSLIKLTVETIPPLTMAAIRGLGGGLLLMLLMGREAPALWRSRIPFRTYLAQALFNCVIPWSLVAWASRTIDSSLATVLNSLSPIFAFLLTWGITRHEAVSARKFAGVVTGLAGVLTIIGVDALTGLGEHTVAEIACVAGSLSYAMAAILGRRFDKLSPLVPSAGSTLVASMVLIPLALLYERPWELQPSMRSVLALGGLIVFSTVTAFIVYFKLLSMVGSVATTSQAYLRIIVGVGIGVVFLGEKLSASLVAGVILVVAGVIAMTLPKKRIRPM